MAIWGRWLAYRRAQRARMDQLRGPGRHSRIGQDLDSDRRHLGDLEERLAHDEQLEHDLLGSTLPLRVSGRPSPDTPAATSGGVDPDSPAALPGTAADPAGGPQGRGPAGDAGPATTASDRLVPAGRGGAVGGGGGRAARRDFGPAGTPFNRQSPFYVGFVGALGVLVAYGVWQAVSELTTVVTLLAVAFFLTLALDPLVGGLTRRGLRRGFAVTLVFLGVLAVFGLVGWVVFPPVTQQATELANNAPNFIGNLLQNSWVQDLDHRYQLLARIQEEVDRRVADGNLWAGVFGGVLDAGKVIASGVFSTLTVLVLTLYFMASLPSVKHAAYSLVPASRRPRIMSLAEEIMRRVGSYAIGQVCVAAINACCAYLMMSWLDLRFAAVLAVTVGFLGLVPMVGATLGAVVVAVVAFFDQPEKALVVIVYFIVYQQIENYMVMPRIMQRTVSVPGAVTIVAALAGGTLLGMLGALLAIPVAAGLLLIYDEVLVPRQRQH
ncbi:putative PurR-regulated permease PerM [Terracoccus luteus]|uniref:Putative PurR-regulated permease PerM n=1 Tax=Terracoccus luteus TaxID=53356 RepID=A0A495XV26_9MICO|nr:AI-2E family transporter [Terracoccus luteus]RKT77369.1 putative PurR-regulated permease PerM [Terracoccus luteus]